MLKHVSNVLEHVNIYVDVLLT